MSRKHWIHGHVTSKWLILSRIIKLMHHQRVASSTWILISASDFHTKDGNCVNFKLPQYRLLTRLSRCALYLFTKEGIRKAKHLSPPWFFLLFLTLISPDSRRRRTKKSRQGHTGGKKIQYLIRLCALIMFVLQYPLCVTEWRQLCRLADCFCFPFSPPLLSWWLFAWCARGKLLNIHFDGTAEKARDLHESHDDSISLWRSFHDFSRNSADAQMDDN